jgi:hypothetical protein
VTGREKTREGERNHEGRISLFADGDVPFLLREVRVEEICWRCMNRNPLFEKVRGQEELEYRTACSERRATENTEGKASTDVVRRTR